MNIEAINGDFTVCQVNDFSEVNFDQKFIFFTKTDEENSLVCPTKSVPSNATQREDHWKGFRVVGPLDFSYIGILSKIATVLAEHDISIFAVSTYNTDYIFVKENVYEMAMSFVQEI